VLSVIPDPAVTNISSIFNSNEYRAGGGVMEKFSNGISMDKITEPPR